MGSSFYILMSILGCISVINICAAKGQKSTKVRTFGLWFNGIGLFLIVLAVVIAIIMD